MTGTYRNPVPTVDAIIEISADDKKKIVLIKRKNPPYGWALPGGFVDYGESVESAVVREVQEETGLAFEHIRQFHVYSNPGRDVRQHTFSVVFVGSAKGVPLAADDAAEADLFAENEIPADMAFDHGEIVKDYFSGRWFD